RGGPIKYRSCDRYEVARGMTATSVAVRVCRDLMPGVLNRQNLAESIVGMCSRLVSSVRIGQSFVQGIVSPQPEQLIVRGGGLPNLQQIDLVRIVHIRHYSADRVDGLRRVTKVVVLVLPTLRCTVVENTRHLSGAPAGAPVVRIGLTGVCVPDPVFQWLFLA